jgi:hypothetical protein
MAFNVRNPMCDDCGRRHALNTRCSRVYIRQSAAVGSCADVDCGSVSDVSHFAGFMDNVCPHCRAHFWRSENISCCEGGKIHFQTKFDVCDELVSLLQDPTFMSNIRQYNMAIAMASVGHANNSLPGICSFILSGKAYHRVSSSLIPVGGEEHKFAQIYLLDVADATNLRMNLQHNVLDPNILSKLHTIMIAVNPWVRQFKSAAANSQNLQWRWNGEDVPDAMILGAIVSEPGDGFRQIMIQHRADSPPQFIPDWHRLYHPLAYPILFPSGQTGWYLGMRSLTGESISRMQYLKYLIMRRDSLSHIQACGRLTLEFWCDAWAANEAAIMEFHRRPQQQSMYRSAHRSAVFDQLANTDARDIGVPVRTVLPSSVVGSPRFYHSLFLNAMALPRRFGKPDLFITMTANPYWPEITAQIPIGSHWQFHPDIVARVFMIKVDSLIDDIRGKKIFGDVAAIVWRVEWQKRGLPHLHLLVILKDHIHTAAQIDLIVSAEIPDSDTNPMLFGLVTQFHLHKPCDMCESAGCRRLNADGSCHRKYPKEMHPRTRIDGDKFPIYRRRARYFVEVKDYNNNTRIITDEWVVPYSPFLLLRYGCHINVEIAAHVKTFKYLYKYVLKSPDSAAIVIDEIEAFIHGRLLSASEAAFRILGLRLHQEWPPVTCLDLHLPNHERMIFDPRMSIQEIYDHNSATDTTLTAWFNLNRADENARSLLYIEVPEYYRWDKLNAKWCRRRNRSFAIGRTYAVSPRNSELYALRLLLNVVRGAVSWRCLLHFEGVIYGTFQESCRARGLLKDDTAAIDAFSEIVQHTTSAHIIRLQFALFLLHVQIESPINFFNMFVSDMVDGDCSHGSIRNVMIDLDKHLHEQHSSLASFGFSVEPRQDALQANNVDLDECQIQYNELYMKCSSEQKQAADHVISEAMEPHNTRRNNVFIVQGGAGTGKTMWINCVTAALKCHHKKVECVASSGLAASLIIGGKTAHSALGIPVPTHESSFCRLDLASRQHFRNVDVIIWDEMSMVSMITCDCVDRSLQDIRNCSLPFGGVIMIFVGDFQQLAPVVRNGKGEFATMHRCSWWQSASKHVFSYNWRALNNHSYQLFLHNVGSGRIPQVDVPSANMCSNFNDLIHRTYGDTIVGDDNNNNMILAFKVQDAAEVNEYVMNLIPSQPSVALASDNFSVDTHNLPSEYVASLTIPGAPAFAIPLKIGARYMIIKNYCTGIVNGTLCKLVGMSSNLIHVQILTGCRQKSVIMLPKCTFHVLPEASGLPYDFTRTQFPIQVAYCVTV